MVLLVFALTSVLLLNSLEIGGFSVNTRLEDEKWQCDTICAGSGGKTEFDMANKICKCYLGKQVDDTDVALVNKRAKVFGVDIETIRPWDHSQNNSTIIKKRNVGTTEEAITAANSHSITATPTSAPMVEEEEPIVGQQQRPINHQHQRLVVGQRRIGREPRPISPEQQKVITQQMREHLNRLGQLTDSRSRQAEIEAIRANLKQLQQTVVVQNPQQRNRMATDRLRGMVVQHPKLRTLRLRPLSGPRVGATLSNSTEHNEVEVGNFKLKKRPHVEIITQDPSLIVEDDE